MSTFLQKSLEFSESLEKTAHSNADALSSPVGLPPQGYFGREPNLQNKNSGILIKNNKLQQLLDKRI